MRVLCASLLLRMHSLQVECRPGINSLVGFLFSRLRSLAKGGLGSPSGFWGLGAGSPQILHLRCSRCSCDSDVATSCLQDSGASKKSCNVVSARFGGPQCHLHRIFTMFLKPPNLAEIRHGDAKFILAPPNLALHVKSTMQDLFLKG